MPGPTVTIRVDDRRRLDSLAEELRSVAERYLYPLLDEYKALRERALRAPAYDDAQVQNEVDRLTYELSGEREVSDELGRIVAAIGVAEMSI